MKTFFRLGIEDFPREGLKEALVGLYEGVVLVNIAFLRACPNTPPLLRSGVVWRREGKPEIVKSIPVILRDGHDDCEGLAAWRAAELRLSGNSRAKVVLYQARPGLWHAIVSDGHRRWDPSRKLGMRGRG